MPLAKQMRWSSPSCAAPMQFLLMSSLINALISGMALAIAITPNGLRPSGFSFWLRPSGCTQGAQLSPYPLIHPSSVANMPSWLLLTSNDVNALLSGEEIRDISMR